MRRRAVLLVTLEVLLGSGCRTSFDDVRNKHRQVLEDKLAQVARVGKLLDLTAPTHVDDERISLPGSAPAGLWGVLGMAPHSVLMYQEAFADPTAHGPTANRIPGSNLFNTCASLLRKGTCPAGGAFVECGCAFSTVEAIFQRCAQVQYLVVVRTLEYGAPSLLQRTTPDLGAPVGRPDAGPRAPNRAVAGADGTRRDGGARRDGGPRDRGRPDTARDLRVESWSFRGGLMRAEVHVFELASGRRMGGFRVRAESNPRIQRAGYLNQALAPTSARTLVDDEFAEASSRAIREEIRRRVRGSFSY